MAVTSVAVVVPVFQVNAPFPLADKVTVSPWQSVVALSAVMVAAGAGNPVTETACAGKVQPGAPVTSTA